MKTGDRVQTPWGIGQLVQDIPPGSMQAIVRNDAGDMAIFPRDRVTVIPIADGPCKHPEVNASVMVNFLEDTDRWYADVRIECKDCGLPFRFIGLPAGLDLNGAAVSIDGCEARLAIAPKGQVVTPLDSTKCGGFTVRKTL